MQSAYGAVSLRQAKPATETSNTRSRRPRTTREISRHPWLRKDTGARSTRLESLLPKLFRGVEEVDAHENDACHHGQDESGADVYKT